MDWKRGLRRLRRPLAPKPPTLSSRSAYKATWDRLAGTLDDAKRNIAGYTDDAELRRQGQHTADVIRRLAGVNPSDVILEIGCGVGRVGEALSDSCARWIGVDISGCMIEHARRRLAGLPNVDLVELATVGLAEIPDASVDLVYCTVVFMHLYEWDRYTYVKEAHRILKAGGRCLFDNVDLTSPHGWKVFTAGLSYPLQARPAYLGMTSTGEELYTYATRAGFERVEIHRWNEAWVGVTGWKRS